MSIELKKNADRFLGFANEYNNYRPKCPQFVVDTLLNYLGHSVETVVDLGCGTGLSTVIWSEFSKKVIGIEPSIDMLDLAIKNSKAFKNIKFKDAYSHETGLESNTSDIITCSQSFHWMEPNSTLEEVNRLLKKRGIFAAYDCDWPPVFKWEVEKEYEKLFDKVNEIEETNTLFKNNFHRWNKNNHLQNIKNSNYFRYVREIVFNNSEDCNAERFIGLAISQGSLQEILKKDEQLIKPQLDSFIDKVYSEFCNKTHKINFCYRMRIGIK